MKSTEIRRSFLDYFGERGHRIVPSSPLVLPADPTLLFANAGMNQFKDVFTGDERRDYARAASSQKCLRVSGKHNDLEMVGRTPRHHTFFEMLGNFSFGDYFKRDAIVWAWELVHDVWGLPAERLWVSVFEGSENAPADEEAERIWRDEVGVDPTRILRLDEKENFWRMGDTGPCGPSSEIHVDLGEGLTSVSGPSTPATDERRFLEIWNLVFMQFVQHDDGRLEALPAPSIDTGMGLERITAVLQRVESNYDTDLFRPLIEATADAAGKRYGECADSDLSMRVIADHARALAFLVADGVVPANDSRGYVLRRVLRRAIRHGRKLGVDRRLFERVCPPVIDALGEVYPELAAARESILEVGRREEQRFAETLTTSLQLFDDAVDSVPEGEGRPVLDGRELFRLYDTYGLPLDLARDVAAERGVALDEAGFEAALAEQRAKAQASFKKGSAARAAPVYAELATSLQTPFVGQRATSLDGVQIVALLREGEPVDRLEAGQAGELVLEETPFYAEAGGQVGDCGRISGADGQARVEDTTRPAPGLTVHRIVVEQGGLSRDEAVHAEVDGARRESIRRNHTATHLLHAALRDVLGRHVKQAGSLVAPDRLRFDFSHFAPVSTEALDEIERLANARVMDDLAVETEEMELDAALASGAMALFGEKYADRVRVVRMGEFSMELCGGTHCERTGEVGLMKLTEERGVASGTRRVEAVTGEGSLDRFREVDRLVKELEARLAVPREGLVAELERRAEELKALQKQEDKRRLASVREEVLDSAGQATDVAGVKVLSRRVDGVKAQELRTLADNLRQKLGSGVVVLGRAEGPKASLLVAVTRDLEGRVPAGELVKELAAMIGGGGGGRRDLAEAGGRDVARLDEALASVADRVGQRLGA